MLPGGKKPQVPHGILASRDDKGRAVTDLEFHESDGAEALPIRLADLSVSHHSPLVIPTNGRDLQCASPGRKNPVRDLRFLSQAGRFNPFASQAGKCLSVSLSSPLLEVDGNAGRNAKQVLVVAGKVRQAGISVINLDRAEGQMLSVLYVQSRAH